MSPRMARAFLGPDVRGIADLVLRHVRFCIVRSFGLNAYRTEVERNRVNSVVQRTTYLAIVRYCEAKREPACVETSA
jgi:hypothetical protein